MTQVSCGAPAELDESLFPGPNEVGYADADGTGNTGTPLGGGGASGQAPNPSAGAAGAGSSGSPAAPPAGSGAGGNAASPPPAGGSSPGGNPPGGNSPGGSAPAGTGGSAQAGMAGGGSTSPVMGGGSAPGGCPDDITVLFNRPITEGGCAGGACHVPGATAPDLVSPNIESRLVDVLSQCGGRPYIGAGDSFLAEKIGGEQPECGFPMPFFMPDALNATDKQCILDWIDEVSGG